MERRTRHDLQRGETIGMRYARRAEEAERHAEVLRGILMEEPKTLIEDPREAKG